MEKRRGGRGADVGRGDGEMFFGITGFPDRRLLFLHTGRRNHAAYRVLAPPTPLDSVAKTNPSSMHP